MLTIIYNLSKNVTRCLCATKHAIYSPTLSRSEGTWMTASASIALSSFQLPMRSPNLYKAWLTESQLTSLHVQEPIRPFFPRYLQTSDPLYVFHSGQGSQKLYGNLYKCYFAPLSVLMFNLAIHPGQYGHCWKIVWTSGIRKPVQTCCMPSSLQIITCKHHSTIR